MRSIIILICSITLLLPSFLSAQETIIFEDNFNDNLNKWLEKKDKDYILQILDGKYSFEHKKKEGAFLALHPTLIDTKRDFSISCNTVWINGAEGSGSGLSWGKPDGTNNYYFGITANGYYIYLICLGAKSEILINYTESEYINKKGSNNISVKKRGSIIEFYINGHIVNQYTFYGFVGNYIGFLVDLNQKILFDDLKIVYLAEDNLQNDNKIENKTTIIGTADVDVNIPVGTQISDKTFVVIIANENYQKEVKVQYATNDGKVFKEYCEKTLGIPSKNIHFAPDASFGNMKSEIKWISDVSAAFNGQAKIIFYYAGHGMPNEADKSAYLLPVDGFSSDFETAIKLDDLYARLASNPAQSITVFLDACFSGSIRDDGMLANARGVKITPKTDIMKGNMIVFSAATGNETAYPYKEKQHGLFTYFLLKKLQETKGDVDYQTLSNYIRDNVKQQSIIVNQKSQTPQVNSGSQVQSIWNTIKLK